MTDCVVIGAGPAGLTAALYLARFRRILRVFNHGESRAALIPITHNYPGFAKGIAGVDLLNRLREQGGRYGVHIEQTAVTDLQAQDGLFRLRAGDEVITTRNVILATGVEDLKPTMPHWREATLSGAVRWCPICDGYEATDQSIALMANAQDGFKHALFLRTYTQNLMLIIEGEGPPLNDEQRSALQGADIRVMTAGVRSLALRQGKVRIDFKDSTVQTVDTLYPMVGCAPRVGLLRAFQPRLDENNLLWVDEHQSTSIDGIYAAGDVVHALNQMAVGMAHAATAATAVHNRLPANFRMGTA